METANIQSSNAKIDTFLSAPAFAVVGASDDERKFGHKCFVSYLKTGRKAYPINPKVDTVLGQTAYKSLKDLPEKIESVSIITPPAVTETVVDEAIELGIKNIWMQPGAESKEAVHKAEQAGINVIYGGPCLLVTLGYFG